MQPDTLPDKLERNKDHLMLTISSMMESLTTFFPPHFTSMLLTKGNKVGFISIPQTPPLPLGFEAFPCRPCSCLHAHLLLHPSPSRSVIFLAFWGWRKWRFLVPTSKYSRVENASTAIVAVLWRGPCRPSLETGSICPRGRGVGEFPTSFYACRFHSFTCSRCHRHNSRQR